MSSRRKSRTKIVNYKRHRKDYHINIGSVFLVILFLYFTIQSIIYITHDKISIYEVTKGSSETTENVVTTGLILRTETVTTAEAAGYINFYAKEGNRISVGETLYTIDESGALSKLLQEAAENGATISDENLSLIKEDISDFTGTFDNNNFSDVYDFKYSILQMDTKALLLIKYQMSISMSPNIRRKLSNQEAKSNKVIIFLKPLIVKIGRLQYS